MKSSITTPLVSVVIPAYRCSETIQKAIDSVLIQSVPLELIIINDCSPEDLDTVIMPYLVKENVIYLRNDHNMGVAKSRNRGVRKARGNYIAYLDADDYWTDDKLEKQLYVMEEKKCVLCYTARELFDSSGESIGKIIPVREEINYGQLLYHNSINCSSVLILAKVAKEFPMERDDAHEDYLTWLRILKKYKKAYGINEPLLKYRLSAGGKSSNKLKSAKMTYQVYRIMELGRIRSIFYFITYILNGIRKHI